MTKRGTGIWALSFLLANGAPLLWGGDEVVGRRPYELEWAGRFQEPQTPLVDFEELDGWRAEGRDAETAFEQTREQQIWGRFVGRLTYHATGANPEVRILPPQPVPIKEAFDTVTLWCYGNNWGWATDPATPRVGVDAVFEDAEGRELVLRMATVDWKEWHLLHRRLTPGQVERVKNGAKFKALAIVGGRNKEPRRLYFDNLSVFSEKFGPLTFEPRSQRGVPGFSGQPTGANVGPGRLPFPTRSKTILPDNLTTNYTITLSQTGSTHVLRYRGEDGELACRFTPQTGLWSDWEVSWHTAEQAAETPDTTVVFRPCVDGGVYLAGPRGPALPEKAEHLGTEKQEDRLESVWRLSAAGITTTVTYVYHLWSKSLVMDVLAPSGNVAEVRFGRATGLSHPRLQTVPFYPADGGRPAVAVSGPEDRPVFLAGHVDWYRSHSSTLWARNAVNEQGVTYHGGVRYTPLTSGARNPCYERFFLTISPHYEEVLPSIPNPPSPWRAVTGTRLWRAHGASNREHDRRHWEEVHRHGITQLVVTDHETMWRDEGESFTFRTRAAPGKGGDAGAYDYARFMQDRLGFVYGPYNNFTDFAPVNEFWSPDLISRDPENQLQRAWMRCYAPKPARAVEYCARLAPLIQEKFRFSTAYCDVHTAVAPWHRVDFDPRAPGAGTFAAVFYAYGEIMLLQKQAWKGPVYSEGNYHCFYMGLTDGNYGQDQSYRPAENPWLVDFDLRKMHDLGCNFGMGNPEMFYANVPQPQATPAQRDAWLDRFLAATVAFGHPGFLVLEGGMGNAMRSYYMLQQWQSRYCLTNAADIRYATAEGVLVDTSRAVAGGACRRSQVAVRYADGTVVAANGSQTERMSVEAFGRSLDLPPNGYAGWTQDGAIDVLSSDARGHRSDYAATPAYLYVDGRGQFARFPKAAGNGTSVCRVLGTNQWEIIPLENAECGFAVEAGSALALDKNRKELGSTPIRRSRGLTYAQPLRGAFSYLLKGPAPAPSVTLRSDRDTVVPGEKVVVHGTQRHECIIPKDARLGDRIWRQYEDAWIDFTVAPLAKLRLEINGTKARVTATSGLADRQDFTLKLGKWEKFASLAPEKESSVDFDLGTPTDESSEIMKLEVACGELSQSQEVGICVARQMVPCSPLPSRWSAGIILRGQPENQDLGSTGAIVEERAVRCGDVEKRAIFTHPPYQGAVGCCFVLYPPVELPGRDLLCAFRASVGKANDSDLGDGLTYKILLVDSAGREWTLGQTNVSNHLWTDLQADLSAWAGQTVRLKLVTDPGATDNTSGDWGCWADMRIESLEPVLRHTLEPRLDRIRRVPGPHPKHDLSMEDLRSARQGWLRYDGYGLEGPGVYATFAELNGLPLGPMTAAHGNEQLKEPARQVGLVLPPQAIHSLKRLNRLVLRNPNKDSFTVGRFWLELELQNGRRCSSDVCAAIFTQPPAWPYGQGILVPFEEPITVEIAFF